jgi:3-deoxy-7-phosphoheptulonate synthase
VPLQYHSCALAPGTKLCTLRAHFAPLNVSQSHPIDDVRIERIRPIQSPAILMEKLPLGEAESAFIENSRQAAERIMRGDDDRLLVVIGPCSIHDRDSAMDYAYRLAAQRSLHLADLEIVMRVYFEKPRTTVGWKGLINDPHLNETFDINAGLHLSRELLIEVVKLGLPTGTEFLDVISPQYIADVVSWGAIGARTTESQIHRQLASGLSMPVGFKNGTDGGVQIALDAIQASAGQHHFLSVTKEGVAAIVATKGNNACHVILRGGKQTNYDAASVDQMVGQLNAKGLPPYVMVDCSHGNSEKDFKRQPLVAADIAAQLNAGSNAIAGVMIESHLVEGAQKKPDTYGQSITDACIGWDSTVDVLAKLAESVRARRAA